MGLYQTSCLPYSDLYELYLLHRLQKSMSLLYKRKNLSQILYNICNKVNSIMNLNYIQHNVNDGTTLHYSTFIYSIYNTYKV